MAQVLFSLPPSRGNGFYGVLRTIRAIDNYIFPLLKITKGPSLLTKIKPVKPAGCEMTPPSGLLVPKPPVTSHL